MSREPLDIWLYGTRVATLRDLDGRLALDWTPDALDRWGPGARLLSAKLTIGDDAVPPLIKNYLDGLLPEGNARVNHAFGAGVPADDTFALIRAYGRDTHGAAIFVPSGANEPTKEGRYQPITLDELAERLRTADEYSPADPQGMADESSTLPGMVPKIVLHRDGDDWFACKEGAPSTWIIKRASPPETDGSDIVDSEVACLSLARLIGLTTVQAEIIEHGGVRGIAVSRYDRDEKDGFARLHQEDLAQALGLNTQDPNRKFQWGARTPSLRQGADVLRLDGGNPDQLLRLATFSLLVGNTDMHAKNISFIRRPNGQASLSPAYDVAMHLHHRRDNRRSALDINGKQAMSEIELGDLIAEGMAWGLPERRARNVVTRTTQGVFEALSAIAKTDYPGVPEEAWSVVEERTQRAVAAPGV
jgi:serine/threonine-protein kinase HipA